MKKFKDYFSQQSKDYQKFRPHHPNALFQYLSAQCAAHELAWDCATGNGQAALGLTPYFAKIIATDASPQQIGNALPHPKIEYRIATAEDSQLVTASVDLITVAQAIHWLDHERFYAETKRVLKPAGVIAIWAYGLDEINPEINAVMQEYYFQVVGPYWPPERKYIEEKLQGIAFPFEELKNPDFFMEAEWDFEALIGYLRTWSASQKYKEATGQDPVAQIYSKMQQVWGDPQVAKVIQWPLYLRVGQNSK